MDYPSLTDGYAAPGNGWWPWAKYPTLWTGCVGSWSPLLGPTGATLFDQSRFANHGTLTNLTIATAWELSGGWSNRHSGASSSRTIIPYSPSLSITTHATVSMWFNSQTASFVTLLATNNTGGQADNGFAVYVNNRGANLVEVQIYNSPLSAAQDYTHPTGWNHALFTVDPVNGLRFLLNGSYSPTVHGSGASSISDNGRAVTIGSFPTTNGYAYNGFIDDLRIYNRALSQNEITQLYQLGRGGSYAIDYEMMMEEIAAGGPFPHFIRRSQQLSGGLVAC